MSFPPIEITDISYHITVMGRSLKTSPTLMTPLKLGWLFDLPLDFVILLTQETYIALSQICFKKCSDNGIVM